MSCKFKEAHISTWTTIILLINVTKLSWFHSCNQLLPVFMKKKTENASLCLLRNNRHRVYLKRHSYGLHDWLVRGWRTCVMWWFLHRISNIWERTQLARMHKLALVWNSIFRIIPSLVSRVKQPILFCSYSMWQCFKTSVKFLEMRFWTPWSLKTVKMVCCWSTVVLWVKV